MTFCPPNKLKPIQIIEPKQVAAERRQAAPSEVTPALARILAQEARRR